MRRAGLSAWNEWLGTGRLAVARAEIALLAEGPDAAVRRAKEAIDLARPVGRLKYETMARSILGTALVALGRGEDGVAELRAAVEGADRLGTPSGRWAALAALGKGCYATGDDDGAEIASRGAANVVRTFADSLTPDHAGSLLSAVPIREIIAAGS